MILKADVFKRTNPEPALFLPRLARAFKSPGYTPGRLKHELWVVVDEKRALFLKSKTYKSASPRYLVFCPAKSVPFG